MQWSLRNSSLYLTKWYHLLRNTEKLLLYFFILHVPTSSYANSFSRFFLHSYRVKISQNLCFQTIRKYLSSYPRIKERSNLPFANRRISSVVSLSKETRFFLSSPSTCYFHRGGQPPADAILGSNLYLINQVSGPPPPRTVARPARSARWGSLGYWNLRQCN